MKIAIRARTILKNISPRKTVVALVGVAVIVFATGGVWAFHATASKNKLAEQAHKAEAAKAQRISEEQQELAKKQAAQVAANDAAGTTNNASPAQPAKTSNPTIKYSTSSDPRSTAYSTTPPPPNPASFTTKITHAGQVTPGTLISYNATKGAKTYYGGDLVLSTNDITTYSGAPNVPITISTPDGASISWPASPWDEHSPYFALVGSSGSASSGSSLQMQVTQFNSPASGTYTLHVVATRSVQAADQWQYDGFITIHIN